MEVVLTAEQMRYLDGIAIRRFKIPSLVLMENAGRSVVEFIEQLYGSIGGKSATVFCGKGNNGGDGFVVARHLHNRGASSVIVVLVGAKRGDLQGDSKTNFEIFKQMVRQNKAKALQFVELKSNHKLNMLPRSDIIIDALFGTGFSGDVRSPYLEVIRHINKSPGIKVSVDVPSGINSTNGSVGNAAVKSDLTVTLGFKKVGLIVGKGRSYTGCLKVADITFPRNILEGIKARTLQVQEEDVRSVLPKRALDAHKYSVGKVFVLAGSRGYTGAAAMTAESALRAGAGMVILGCPQSVYPILAKKLTEVIVVPFPDTENGAVALAAMDELQKHLDWANIVVVGPGLSRDAETQQVVRSICQNVARKLVIDADGLNALAENLSVLKKRRSKEIILTPHTGEFSRLTGLSSDKIEQERVESARRFAQEYRLTLVLKGAPTITAASDGMVYINSAGNAGMATAGVGDVLTGVVAGLWAQGMKERDAAFAGVFVHGKAGDIARDRFGEKSLLAMDVQQCLPDAFNTIERGC